MICVRCQQPMQGGEDRCPRCGAPVSATPPYAGPDLDASPSAPAPGSPPKPPERQVWQPPRRDFGEIFGAPSWPSPPERVAFVPPRAVPYPSAAADTEAAPETPALSTARLFGFLLLMCLPLVGLLCACLWAFGRRAGAQLKNLSRASLLFFLTLWVLLAAAAWWAVTYHLPVVSAVWEALG